MSQSLNEVKIKLSRKDGRVVTLLIFLEFFSRSIMQMTDKESDCFTHVRLPADKVAFYDAIHQYMTTLVTDITGLNNRINDEYLKIFPRKDFDTIIDSVLALVALVESEDPAEVKRLLEKLDWKVTVVSRKGFKDEKEGSCTKRYY